MKFRKKPIVVEAVQLRWDMWGEMCAHADVGKLEDGKPEGTLQDTEGTPFPNGPGLLIPTVEGILLARPMDWIIRGVRGEIYPCKPEIFEDTYERVEDNMTTPNPHVFVPSVEQFLLATSKRRSAIYDAIEIERGKQFAKYGDRLENLFKWMVVIAEALEEANEVLLKDHVGGHLRDKLVQVAAGVVAAIETNDHQMQSEKNMSSGDSSNEAEHDGP